ncbi:HNH endonuclease [Candidatus Saccharibacteria bacterium]|nr:MAG: HNH endonuclease [Candidatus Saccharibacteria bacterium]
MPNYGKGRYKKNGYVMVFAATHPKTFGKRSKYVLEHILVMEEHLGRYLEADENVHHRNGIKDDNRIENLELWIRPQPSGIRAQDAVTWAEKILERYGKSNPT